MKSELSPIAIQTPGDSALNGVPVSSVDHHDYGPGHIAWQVQGRKMYWRNLRIKVE